MKYTLESNKNWVSFEASLAKTRRLIKKHLFSDTCGGAVSCYVRLSNGNNRLLLHSFLDEPLKKLPWPFSIFQRRQVWACSLSETTNTEEKIFNNTYQFSELDKAVSAFLEGVGQTETILLQKSR